MDKKQESQNKEKRDNRLLALHSANIILLFVNFALNFIGSPDLKYIYLLQVACILLTILIFDFENTFLEILILFFIEGQGRIIWQYAGWARIIFDIVTLTAMLKVFISRKKIIKSNILPWPILMFIMLHFMWFIVELFNVNAASFFGSIAATKMYIFPILLFFALLLTDLVPNTPNFDRILTVFVIILILEMSLNYFQLTVKQNHLIGISTYYLKSMKDGVFTDTLFRPFATTQLPGALAVFLFLTVGFLYFLKNTFKMTIIKFCLIGSALFSIITCQIRSALVKYLLVVGLIQFGMMLFKRFHPKHVVPVFIVGLFLIIGGKSYLTSQESTGDENLDYAKSRISTLTEVHKIETERLNLNGFGKIILDKLSRYPLGVGPGMTGPAASLNKEALINNPLINEDFLWTSDNLLISLAIDLGIGALFYVFLVLSIPVFFVRNLLTMYAQKDEENYQTLLVCTSTLVVILIGNWGALGLTYNPESFIFWFFAAMGFKIIGRFKDAKTIPT